MTLPPAARGLLVAAPFVLAAGLALVFDVFREIPVDPGCGEFASPAEERAADVGVGGAIALSGERAIILLAPLALIVIGFLIVAGAFTAPGTAIVAALALGASSVWIYRGVVDRDATYGPRAALWVLAVLTGAHLLLVLLQGEGSYFC